MPLSFIVRLFTTLLSLIVLGGAAYLLWSWYDGDAWLGPNGGVVVEREAWRLWTGLALLAWSVAGRFPARLLLARRDGRTTYAERDAGGMIDSGSGAELYVEQHGTLGAPPVIFTHGWGLDSTIWCYAKQDLSDRFRMLTWDLPGLGKSKRPPHGMVSLPQMAVDLSTVMAMTTQPVVLVGHSIGGMTIQTLVRDRPDLVRRIAGIVLLDTSYTNPLKTMILSRLLLALRRPVLEPAMKLTIWLTPLAWLSAWQSYLSGSAHMAQRVGYGKHVTRSQLDHSALLSTRNSPGVQAHGDLAMFDWDATDALRDVGVPVLVIAGDMDIVTKLEANRRIAAVAGGRLEVVAGANHMGPVECADRYNQLIGDFILQVQPVAAGDVRPQGAELNGETRSIAEGASERSTRLS